MAEWVRKAKLRSKAKKKRFVLMFLNNIENIISILKGSRRKNTRRQFYVKGRNNGKDAC